MNRRGVTSPESGKLGTRPELRENETRIGRSQRAEPPPTSRASSRGSRRRAFANRCPHTPKGADWRPSTLTSTPPRRAFRRRGDGGAVVTGFEILSVFPSGRRRTSPVDIRPHRRRLGRRAGPPPRLAHAGGGRGRESKTDQGNGIEGRKPREMPRNPGKIQVRNPERQTPASPFQPPPRPTRRPERGFSQRGSITGWPPSTSSW